MVSGDPNAAGNNKKNMFRAVRDSLARLQMDYIDILYVHFWDWSVNIKDLMRDLNEIVLSGKVLHIAASDIPAWVVATGNTIAEQHGWSKFVCYQGSSFFRQIFDCFPGKYNLTERDMEMEIIPMCNANQIATVPWGAVAQGKLTGVKTRENPTNGTRGRVVMTENDFKIQDVVIEIAKEIGKSPSQVALAWIIQKSTSPLLGSRTLEQLEDSLQAVDIVLSPEQLKRLEEISTPKPIFPYTMLGKDTKSTGVLWAPNPMQKTYDFDTNL